MQRLPAVFDTSPLIFLAALEYTKLLPNLYEVYITNEVRKELRAKPEQAGGRVPDLSWISQKQPIPERFSQINQSFSAGPGEVASIALALDLDSWVVLDDKQARAFAKHFCLKLVGTVGVLKRIHENNLNRRDIEEDLTLLDRAGMHLSPRIRQVLSLV